MSKTANLLSPYAKQADWPTPGALLSLQKLESEIASIRQATDAPLMSIFAHQQPDYTQNDARKNGWMPTTLLSRIGFDPRRDSHDRWTSAIFPRTSSASGGFKSPLWWVFILGYRTPLLTSSKIWGDCDISATTPAGSTCWLQANGADMIIAQDWSRRTSGYVLSQDLTPSGHFSLLPNIIRSGQFAGDCGGRHQRQRFCTSSVCYGSQRGKQVGTAFCWWQMSDTQRLSSQALQWSEPNTPL